MGIAAKDDDGQMPAGLRRIGGFRYRLLFGSARGDRHARTQEREEETKDKAFAAKVDRS